MDSQTNFQFPFSQRSQFPPSSKITKSYDKNYFTSTYPVHKHIVRNLPCAKYQRQKDIKPAFICHKVHFWKEKHINCNFELVHQKLYLWLFFLSFLILLFPFLFIYCFVSYLVATNASLLPNAVPLSNKYMPLSHKFLPIVRAFLFHYFFFSSLQSLLSPKMKIVFPGSSYFLTI